MPGTLKYFRKKKHTIGQGIIGNRFVSAIPLMTANSVNGYTASSSSIWSNPPYWQNYFPFSANPSTGVILGSGGWIASATISESYYASNPYTAHTLNEWLSIQLPSPQKFLRYGLCWTNSLDNDGYPVGWVLEGSSNGTNWTVLDTVSNYSGWVADITKMSIFTIANPGNYTYYRWRVTNTITGIYYWSNGAYIHDISFI